MKGQNIYDKYMTGRYYAVHHCLNWSLSNNKSKNLNFSMIRNVTAPAEYLRSFSVGPTNVLSWFSQDGSRRHGYTRTSGQLGVLEPAGEPKLPRYLRRRALQAGPTHSVDTKYLPKTTPDARRPSETVRKFRSRHYDPSRQEAKSEVRLLEPYVLSARLKKCCDAGNLDEAVAMLKNAPLDAQNTPVWNTLIWECLKVKRFQLGYQLFIDVMSLFRYSLAPFLKAYVSDEKARVQSNYPHLSDHVQRPIKDRALGYSSQTTRQRKVLIRWFPTAYSYC
jgi:hypothetical protein